MWHQRTIGRSHLATQLDQLQKDRLQEEFIKKENANIRLRREFFLSPKTIEDAVVPTKPQLLSKSFLANFLKKNARDAISDGFFEDEVAEGVEPIKKSGTLRRRFEYDFPETESDSYGWLGSYRQNQRSIMRSDDKATAFMRRDDIKATGIDNKAIGTVPVTSCNEGIPDTGHTRGMHDDDTRTLSTTASTKTRTVSTGVGVAGTNASQGNTTATEIMTIPETTIANTTIPTAIGPHGTSFLTAKSIPKGNILNERDSRGMVTVDNSMAMDTVNTGLNTTTLLEDTISPVHTSPKLMITRNKIQSPNNENPKKGESPAKKIDSFAKNMKRPRKIETPRPAKMTPRSIEKDIKSEDKSSRFSSRITSRASSNSKVRHVSFTGEIGDLIGDLGLPEKSSRASSKSSRILETPRGDVFVTPRTSVTSTDLADRQSIMINGTNRSAFNFSDIANNGFASGIPASAGILVPAVASEVNKSRFGSNVFTRGIMPQPPPPTEGKQTTRRLLGRMHNDLETGELKTNIMESFWTRGQNPHPHIGVKLPKIGFNLLGARDESSTGKVAIASNESTLEKAQVSEVAGTESTKQGTSSKTPRSEGLSLAAQANDARNEVKTITKQIEGFSARHQVKFLMTNDEFAEQNNILEKNVAKLNKKHVPSVSSDLTSYTKTYVRMYGKTPFWRPIPLVKTRKTRTGFD